MTVEPSILTLVRLLQTKGESGRYFLCFSDELPVRNSEPDGWQLNSGCSYGIMASDWERFMPSDLHLPLGGGPLRIEIGKIVR